MNQKKALSKKFHRKYVFLQNSLIHFLDWRVSEFSNFMNLTTYNGQTKSLFMKNNKNTFHFLEQEKICFQDYWKNSEHKKLENAIQNMNKELIPSKNTVDFQNSFNFSKKINVFNIQNKSLFFQLFYSNKKDASKQKAANQPSKLAIAAKNRLREQSSSNPAQQSYAGKKRSFFVDNKKTFISFSSKKMRKQLQQKKYSRVLEKSQLFSFNTLETFIPKSDIFRKRNLFFVNQKIGEFFPKKKNFTQYWIFPLLGFVVFFHSTPTFLNARFKQVFEKSLSLSLNSYSLNDHKQQTSQNSLTFIPIFSKPSSSSFPIRWIHQENNFSQEKKWKQQNFNSILDFSYTNEFSKEAYHQMKNLENNEFEKYCDFSFKIFQNSPHFFLFDLLNNSTNTDKKEIQSLLYFYNKNFLNKNIYRKLIETKRNTFHWKWFSLNSQFLNFPVLSQQKNKASFFYLFEIPQKAQFFNPIFENNSLFDFSKFENQIFDNFSSSSTFTPQTFQKLFTSPQKSNFSQTPLLNFSKTMFLFNEFERNLNNIFHINFLNKKDCAYTTNATQHNKVVLENFKFLNDIVSLSEAKTESSNFHLFKTWNNSFLEFSKSSSFFNINILQKYKTNSLNSEKQNVFFLTKWLQTQNLWKVTKNSSSSKSFSKFSNFQPGLRPAKVVQGYASLSSAASVKKKIDMGKNLGALAQPSTTPLWQNSLKIPHKFITIENLMNLDFIYFRKLFSSLSASKERVNNKTLKTLNTLSNFSQFLKLMHNRNIFPHSVPHSEKTVSNAIVEKKKTAYSFVLKKRTFEFFIFQHYKHNYKKLINHLLSSSNKEYQQENKIKNKDFVQQNSQNLFPIITNKFHENIFTKYKNTNEKTIFKNFQNSSKINCLSIPIYLNFSNKKSFEKLDIHFEKQNKVVSQNKMNSSYFNSISKYENLEARSNNLSSIYFHLLNNKKVSLIRQNFFHSKSFFKSKIDFVQTIYEKTLTNIKKNQFFSFSTFQLESLTFQNHFLFEKIKKEKPFIFHNHENFSPLVFFSTSLKTKQSLLKSSKFFVLKEKPSFFVSNKSKSFQQKTADIGQPERQRLTSQSTKLSTATKTQFFKNYFQDFQSRKYEKIFKTFLTPLNKENVSSFFFTNKSKKLNIQEQNFKEFSSSNEKMINTKKLEKNSAQQSCAGKIFSKFKTSKDTLILQSLSTSVQENFMNSNSVFFISFHKRTQPQKKNISNTQNFSSEIKKNTNDKIGSASLPSEAKTASTTMHNLVVQENCIQSNLFSALLKENHQIKTHEKSKNQNFKKLLPNRTPDVLYPSFILKRDGFVFFPSFMPFDVIQTQTQKVRWQPVHQKLTSQPKIFATATQKTFSFDFPIQRIRETNSFTLKRLEQEKSFQKKRRLKKQKLETRRRKKRKRFFPRPVWLRFHLYKKFLKTRHPNLRSNFSIFLENEKDKNFIVSKNLSLIPKNIFVLFPIKSKYQNIKAFSKNKTNFFVFHFSNTEKFQNILYSSFFNKTFRFQNKIDASKAFNAKNIFVHQNSDQNLSTIFKSLNKNDRSNIYKKKSNSYYRNSLKNHNEFSGNKIYRKNRQNWGFSWKKSFLASSEKYFYKKFESNIHFYNQTNIFKKFSPISQNLEHYKISGEILSEFVRLSWKSYWFLTNFQPYTKRITQNFRKMQKIESERNFSNFLAILFNKKSPMLFQSLPIFHNHFSDNSQDLLLRNSVFRKFAWYFNIKNSLEENSVLGNSFNQLNQKSLNFQNIQNFPEYNRILYSRVSEILRNFKSFENTDDQFMYMRDQKNSNIPKRKNEIISSNSSFFTKNALFFENFHIPSQPSIPAFSIFSSIFHDFSIKPTGEIPTLRSLWALHQTNFYHFQEKNAVRHLWTLKKRTDNLKSFKGTKKAVHFFRKYSGLEKLNSPRLLNQFTSKSDFFNSMKKHEFSQKIFASEANTALPVFAREADLGKLENYRQDQGIYPFVKKSNFFIFENLLNKKKYFISNFKSNFHDFVQQLDILSFQKFLNSQKKCSLFGIHTIQQNSKMSLRYLKFHLFSNTSKQRFLKSLGTRNKVFNNNFVSSNRQNIEQLEYSFVFKNKDLNQQNSSKSSLNFWWSQKNFTGFDFFMNSQNTRLNSLQFIPFFSNEIGFFNVNKKILSQHTENFALINENNFFANFHFPFLQIELNDTNKNKYLSLQTQILWFGAIIFHLAIFFTVLKLPEIRSVLKFQCILFSKVFAGFFFIIFSLYNFFQKYTKKGTFVAKKILLNTSTFVKKNKSFDEFSFDLKHSSEFQNYIFSRNKNLQQKNLINFLFYFEDSPKSSFVHLNNTFTSNQSYLSHNQWSTKNKFFELFLRLSKFSSLFSKNQNFKKYKKYKNLNLFFISVHNFYNLKNFYSLEKIVGKPTSYQLSETKQAAYQPLIGKLATNTKSFLKISKNFIVPKTQKFPMTFFKNSKSIFYFQNSTKQFEKKNFVNWENSIHNDFLLSFYSYGQTSFTTPPLELKTLYSQSYRNEFYKQKFLFNKNKKKSNIAWQKILGSDMSIAMKSSNNKFFIENKKLSASLRTSSQGSQQNWQSLQQNIKNLQTLSKNEKFICQLALSFLFVGKSTTIFTSNIVQFSTNVSSKILDFVETIMFSIYKFLEKPAEVLIEWIAFIFLIEWSSDIATFVPDTFDISLTKSFQKLNRPIRSGSFFLNFLTRYDNLFFSSSTYFGSNFPTNFMNFFGFWSYVNLTSFILQKRMFYFFENFCSTLLQPDMDLLTRQRKGIIFWDIWAEILLKAAEKYNVNIPSFVTLKEEQELFIEKLLQDKEFLNNLQNQTQQYQKVFYLNKKAAMLDKQQRKTLNGESIEQNSLTLFIENFIEKERFQQFYEFSSPIENKSVNKNKQNIEQLAISKFLFSQILESDLSNHSNSLFEKLFSSKIPILKTKKQKATYQAAFHQMSKSSNQQKFFMLFSQPIFIDSFSSGADFYSLTKFDRSSTYGGNQSGTYQGPETDLFIDIHPPKSLKHIQFSKYYEPAQYTLGSLICQVYSGLFSKQISKNILVIGAPGTAKTLFIQALAGETEMKMITDNAYRYSMVLRGVAVGMKYLRDVFDALALQTPCFFLMEHIHVLGSKRPFLISDDENIKGIQANVGLEQQEVHETNQMIYQLNRHSIVDYKRPYKGDFSMGIPTNFFVQSFYSNSENNSNSIFLSAGPTGVLKNSIFSAGTVNAQNRNPISPLPVDSIEHSLLKQGFAEKEKTDNAFQNGENSQKQNVFQSRLQTAQEQIFAPPATSPFTILMMKEQKKLKPKKIVQENSWGGLSTDQLISYQKESSSVRAKVALLADITMNLSRGKLDMITDLLVIIDSVRSNRGFVVFATTHLPSLLDPALRRPGRFDETISLAQSPNFLNRFEIFKTNFQNSLTTLDFLDSSIFTENLSEMNLLNLITKTKLSFFHQYKYTTFHKISLHKKLAGFVSKANATLPASASSTSKAELGRLEKLKSKFIHKENKQEQRLISQIYPTKALHSFLKSSFFYDLYCKKQQIFHENSKQNLNSQSSKYFLRNLKLLKYTILPKGPSHILNFAYSKIGTFLAQSNLLQDPTAFIPLSLDTNSSFAHGTNKNIQFLGNILYDSQKQQKLQFMIFLSGKIAEFCLQKNTLNSFQNKKFDTLFSTFSSSGELSSNNKLKNLNLLQNKLSNKNVSLNTIDTLNKPSSLFHHKFSLFSSLNWQNENNSIDLGQRKYSKNILLNSLKNQSQTSLLLASKDAGCQPSFDRQASKSSFSWANTHQQKTDFYWTTFGNDQIWRFLTPFLFSIIQKRFLFTKNLLLSKMLFFDNKNTRKLPPNPPSSSILMPSKKFENFKRTENDFVQKSRFSINEKIQMHQQQRFLKQLYNIPIQQYFRSEMIENRTTLFSSSFQELAYLDSLTRRFSSSHFYQRKYLVIRHRFSNTNQWWNGLLPEHNTETTYLSDVDWRTMFANGTSKQKSSYLLKSSQNISLEQKTFSPEKVADAKQPTNLLAGQSTKTTAVQKQYVLSEKDKNQTFEFIMDFPDAEQYYNPRNRRWYLNNNFYLQFSNSLKTSSFVDDKKKHHSVWQNQKTAFLNKTSITKNVSINTFDMNKNSSYWLTFDKPLQYEIYYHYLMQSFHETFYYFNTHREMLDLFVFQLLRKGFLKELDYLMTVSRF